jgi:hypothetical protein
VPRRACGGCGILVGVPVGGPVGGLLEGPVVDVWWGACG